MIDIFSISVDLDLLKLSFTSADPWEKTLITEKFAEENIITIKKIISTTEVNSKVYKSSLYKEVISDSMHATQWKKATKDKIQNLKNHWM